MTHGERGRVEIAPHRSETKPEEAAIHVERGEDASGLHRPDAATDAGRRWSHRSGMIPETGRRMTRRRIVPMQDPNGERGLEQDRQGASLFSSA